MWRRAAVILGAVAAAATPFPAALIERGYSTTLYPRIQSFVTTLSNLAPFALVDGLIIGTLAAWLLAIVSDVRRGQGIWSRIAWTITLRSLAWIGTFYLAFLLVWGLNYRRAKLADKLQFDETAISSEAALTVAMAAVDQLNAIHAPAHELGWPPSASIDDALATAFHRVLRELGGSTAVAIARPKATLLDLYFRRAGVVGMTNPYFLETLVASDLLPFERSAVIAHEWSHLAGFADESEASFVGWLTCIRGSVADRYSGWLALYEELAAAVDRSGRAVLAEKLAPGPRADLLAIRKRLQQEVSPTVSAAGWQVYDRYLKANRVEAGRASYAEVVRLVLGVRFGPGWAPKLAAPRS